jgi:methylphosphotriester-DNA--protein-cysteine methyltransferase
MEPVGQYRLMGPDGPYQSLSPGRFGGNQNSRIYGRLDCPSALRAIARGGYRQHRVFFANEETAIAAGYRPCGNCLREAYRSWARVHALEMMPSSDGE